MQPERCGDGVTRLFCPPLVLLEDLFDSLKFDGVFTGPTLEIVNSDLVKLSPLTSLIDGQAFAVETVVGSLFDDMRSYDRSTTDIPGVPRTGRTVVAN
ncbi:hypothetical protein [Herbiconiux solani]|uniref:hypothetical protein n=1 Tax=Herbiconiux solani TaxID=661329 RepID=UPI000824F58D|nr:hypothetical protein [Herbiconiux solani]